MAEVKPIPEGFHTATVHLWQHDCRKATEWYERVFGAESLAHLRTPDGSAALHVLLKIGDSMVMMADAWHDAYEHAPHHRRGTSAAVWLYVEDADAVFKKAVDAGAEVMQALEDVFWGDRFGKLKDPYGHVWAIATHIEDVPPEELSARAEAAARKTR